MYVILCNPMMLDAILFIHLTFPEIQETSRFLHNTKACCVFHNRHVGELEKGVV